MIPREGVLSLKSGIPGLLSIVLILVACSASEKEVRSHSFRVLEESGISIAENMGGPKYEGELFHYSVLCSLKEDPDRPDSFLNRPRFEYITDSIGNYYIADGGNERIAVFNSEGRFIRSFGREGSGPGEFQSVAIQQVAGNILTIWDLSLRRATQFNINGTFLRVLTPGDRTRISGYHEDSEGRSYRFYRLDFFEIGEDHRGYGVTILSAEGDTLADICTPPTRIGFSFQNPDGSGIGYWLPFIGQPIVHQTPSNQVILCDGKNYRLSIFDPEGTLEREIRFIWNPKVISRADIDSIMAGIRSRMAFVSNERGRENLRRLLENIEFPDYKGFAEDIFMDTSGFIWAQYPVERLSGRPEIRKFRIISPAGEYLGDTTVPAYRGRVMQGKLLGWIQNPTTGGNDAVVFQIHSAVPDFDYPE